jgi:prepilin-type processing-associated H-X9-DG protein
VGKHFKTRGITLVEILVIAVIATILFVVFMPVSPGGRGSARGVACLSNVKQLDLGLIIYATDFDDHMPRASVWSDELGPYVKSKEIHECPELAGLEQGEYGHAFYRTMGGRLNASILEPASAVVLFDSTNLTWNANGSLNLIPSEARHPQGLNAIGFADGHAKLLTRYALFRRLRPSSSP